MSGFASSMLFDGKGASSKKKVSLGGKGSKTNESKTDFLNRTRKEREEREAHRKREKASERVQAFVRGRTQTHLLRRLEREGWDEEFGLLELGGAGVDLNRLASLLRRLLFFYRPKDDGGLDDKRLTRLNTWLVTGGAQRMQLLDAGAKEGMLRCSRLSTLSLERLRLTAEVKSDGQAVDAALILRMCDAEAWGGESGGIMVAGRVTKCILQAGLMGVFRAYLDRDAEWGAGEELRIMLCGVVAHVLGAGAGTDATRYYVLDVLCRMVVGKRITGQCRKVLEFRGLWGMLLGALSGPSLLDEACAAGGERAANLLANLLEMSSLCLGESNASETGAFASVASRILAHIIESSKTAAGGGDAMEIVNDDDDDDDMDVEMEEREMHVETAAGMTTVKHYAVRSSRPHAATAAGGGMWGLSPELTATRSHIKAICSKQYVLSFLDVLLKTPRPDARAALSSPSGAYPQEFMVVSGTCALLLQLIDFLPEARSIVLNALAFKPQVLGMLWDWVRFTVPKAVVESGGATAIPQASLSPLLGLHSMFCLVYRYLLITVDNAEFFERQYPFTLAEVREMVRVIKAIIFPLYWRGRDDKGLNDATIKLREHGTRLLSRLFERNCHHEFVPRDDWYAPTRHVNAVTSQLDAFLVQRLTDPDAAEAEGQLSGILDESQSAALRGVPFAMPFDLRVRVLRQLVYLDKARINDIPQDWVRVTIHRNRVVSDSFEELFHKGSDIKRTVQIAFVNEDSGAEAGIDGGGLFKEFLNTLSIEAFGPQNGLFMQTSDLLLFPNPQAKTAQSWRESMDYLPLMEFLGRVVGKAIYDGILVELRLAPFFLRKMLGKEMYFDDLASLDADLHRNLIKVKDYQGDLEDLGLFFAVDEDHYGEKKTMALIDGGQDIPVSKQNFLQYKNLVSDYWLNKRIVQQCRAFMRGLQSIVKPEWLNLFSPDELQMIISGSTRPIDVRDLEANTVYAGGYTRQHPTVEAWWRVLETLDNKDLELLLKFVTSCSRPPLLGFRELHPPFMIQKTSHSKEEADSRLPTASTCMNLLKLPSFTNEETLKERLLYALHAEAGFELS